MITLLHRITSLQHNCNKVVRNVTENAAVDQSGYLRLPNVITITSFAATTACFGYSFYAGNYMLAALQLAGVIGIAYVIRLSYIEHHKTVKQLALLEVELKKSNEDAERINYIVSHDIKAPIRNISSFLKLLSSKYNATLPPDAREFVEHSKGGADKLAGQIDDLVAYCRLGKNLPPVSAVDLNQMIKTIGMELSARAGNATVHIERELPALKDVHPGMVFTVFQNLIANGIKFNTSGNREVKIDFTEKSDEVVFSITDNGIGIGAGYEDKLFQVFKKLHSPEKFGGSGIGLASCRKIVTFYQGSIWYTSQAEKGTTFFFTLPKRFIQTAIQPSHRPRPKETPKPEFTFPGKSIIEGQLTT